MKKIFVTNLPPRVGDSDLLALFSSYGEVYSAKVAIERNTKKSRCFGFVSMNEHYAENAIQHLNGYVFHGFKIIVRYDNKL